MEQMVKGLSRQAKEVSVQLGRRIKESRKERSLTQEGLAEFADISPTYLGLIEIGKKVPSLATLIQIANGLKIPVFQLFMFEPEVTPKRRLTQELINILEKRTEEETRLLLALEKSLQKIYPQP